MKRFKVTRARVEEAFAGDYLRLWLYQPGDRETGEMLTAEGAVSFKYYDALPESVNIDREAAQQLVDSFWTLGIRPNAAKGSAGQLSAVEAHRREMSEITGRLLDRMLGPRPPEVRR